MKRALKESKPTKLLQKILLTGIFFCFAFSSHTIPFYLPYFSIFLTSLLLILLICIYIIKSKKDIVILIKKKTFKGNLDSILSHILLFLWLFIFISWLYGLTKGIYHGVPAKFVFRNFFSLSFYLFFPFLIILKPSIKSLIKLIILASIVQMIYHLMGSISFLMNYSTTIVLKSSLSELRIYFSSFLALLFPLFTISFSNF